MKQSFWSSLFTFSLVAAGCFQTLVYCGQGTLEMYCMPPADATCKVQCHRASRTAGARHLHGAGQMVCWVRTGEGGERSYHRKRCSRQEQYPSIIYYYAFVKGLLPPNDIFPVGSSPADSSGFICTGSKMSTALYSSMRNQAADLIEAPLSVVILFTECGPER